jgi:hypothetical protein
MPRQKNTRPTSIYWLVDIRPETIAAGWAQGLPFYCGKSVRPEARLREHKRASSLDSSRPVLVRIYECGESVRLDVLETIDAEGDWISREKHHIALLRRINPECTNVADGGEGIPGFIPNEQQRANIGAATRARSQCPKYRSRLSASHKGQKLSPKHREQCAAHLKRLTKTPEYLAGNAARMKSRWECPEYRAKMTAYAVGKTLDAAARKKISDSKRVLSLETRKKLSAAASKRWAHRV